MARLRPRERESLIGVQQETLGNGLHVIYMPMHRAPVVDVRVVYHVGSRDERPDRHGYAHLFEHMMFRGSAHVGPEEHARLIRAVGGIYDGETTQDATTYFETLPRNQLALGLYLEADRMASFHVTRQIYRIERNVVLEELALRANQPYWAPRGSDRPDFSRDFLWLEPRGQSGGPHGGSRDGA